MYKWLQKNNKTVLAVIMIFLMIAFLLPSTFQGCSGRGSAIGSVGGRKFAQAEVVNAYNEWEYVRQRVLLPNNRNGQQDFVPLLAATQLRGAMGPIEQNKMMYFLLREEAQRMGASISPAQLDAVLAQVVVQLDDKRIVDFESIRESNQGKIVRSAVANVLSIEAAFMRAAANVKVSKPQRELEMAAQLQTLTLGLVPFEAAAYAEKISAPTQEQLAAQFAKHADVLANPNGTKENPFGFGYKFPDRVKLQYITLQREEIRKAVMAQKSDYEWEVDARKYYMNNLTAFPSTQPATTQAAGTTQPVASTQPAVRPFEEVKSQALDAVLSPKIDTLARMVQQRVQLALNNDFTAFAKAKAMTPPPTEPAKTSLGPPFDSFEYLQALAADVQKQFGVVAKVVNLGDQLRSFTELAALEQISEAEAMVQGRAEPFANYVFLAAEPLMPVDSKNREQSFALRLFQPSQALAGFDGTFSIFRLTAAEAARKPASIEEVAAKVAADLKLKLQYEAALADANKLIEASAAAGFNAAASSMGKLVIDSGPLRLVRPPEIPGIVISPASQRAFTQQAFDLLAVLDPTMPSHKAIELPLDAKVLAADLRDVRNDLPADLLAAVESEIAGQVASQTLQQLAAGWFNYDSVVQRTAFVDPYAKPPTAASATNPN